MMLMAASETGRSTLFTVIVNDLSLTRAPVSVARTVAVAVPESLNPGARFAFPVVAFVVETVKYVGPDTCEIVSVFAASRSFAVAEIGVIAVPSAAVADVGFAVMVGGVLVTPGAFAPSQSNQSPASPFAGPLGFAPHGSL